MANSKSVTFEVNRYPSVQLCEHACTWFRIQTNLGLANNTLHAYGRSLNDFLVFTAKSGTDVCHRQPRAHLNVGSRSSLTAQQQI